MRIRTIMALALACSVPAITATGTDSPALDYTYFLRETVDLDRLPYVLEGVESDQFSSYDPASHYDRHKKAYVHWEANQDWGNYVRLDERTGEAVMADIRGPGCINRIWSANPRGKIRFYLDGDEKPTYEFEFAKLFSGKIEPFTGPLVWRRNPDFKEVHSASCLYTPIPFGRSCRIVADEPHSQYYLIGYTTYPEGTPVKTFRLPLTKEEKEVLKEVSAKLSAPGEDPQPKDLVFVEKEAVLEPGKSLVLDAIQGPGIIERFEARIEGSERAVGRKLLLTAHWDGEREPGIWCPLGDFFGEGFSAGTYRSLPLGKTGNGNYCFFRMPFQKKARFAVEHQGQDPVTLSLRVHYRKVDSLPGNAGHFHAKWRRERECGVFDYPILDVAKTRGRFVGCALSVDNVHGGWWGEGDEKIYVDAEVFPSYYGTGSEDYFGDAWGIRNFQNPYHGCIDNPALDGRQQTCYRWHITDSVPFSRAFRMTIENYTFSEPIKNDYASVAYWYALPGGKDFFEPVGVEDRLPQRRRTGPDRIEAETLFSKRSMPSWAEVITDDRTEGDYSGGGALRVTAPAEKVLTFPLPVKEDGRYAIEVSTTPAGGSVPFTVLLNGEPAGDRETLRAGKQKVGLRFEEAGGTLEVDYFRLVPYRGFIRTWRLIGPFPNPQNNGLFVEYPPEKDPGLECAPGKGGKEVCWKEVQAGEDGIVSVVKYVDDATYGVIYASVTVESPREMKTVLRVGSDDGIRAWLNGERVINNRVDRGVAVDQDSAEVTLKAGPNTLLLKVDQGNGGWGYVARFEDPEDELVYRVK